MMLITIRIMMTIMTTSLQQSLLITTLANGAGELRHLHREY